MPRRLRAAILLACAGFLFGAQALASPGDGQTDGALEPGTGRSPTVGPSADSVARSISSAGPSIASIEAAIADVDRSLEPLETTARVSEQTLDLLRRNLDRRSAMALDVVSTWTTADVTTVEQLAEPLQVIARALDALGQFRMALVGNLAEAEERGTLLEALGAQGTSIRFHLDRILIDLETILTGAVSATRSTGSGADLEHGVQVLIGRAQNARLALRDEQARVQALSVELGTERTGFQEGMHSADGTEKALFGEMFSAEGSISLLVPSLFGDAPPIVGAVDPGGVLQVCPVDPPNAYSDDFGAPRYAGGYHPHQGNDIFAPEGTAIRAPFPGNAVDTSNTLGGQAVSVYGAAGYVYNAHLSSFGILGPVETGEIIGYVGNTGDAVNTPPHDHFEWHPDNGSAVDPYVFLNAVCRLGPS